MATKSEDVIGAKMDSCLANGAIKLGAGEKKTMFVLKFTFKFKIRYFLFLYREVGSLYLIIST